VTYRGKETEDIGNLTLYHATKNETSADF